jgi:hypothetical protein
MEMKKSLTILLFCTVLCVVTVFVQTENDFQVALTADYTGAIITRYTGQGIATIRIPETLQEFPVKEIANGVFRGNQTITSVALPSTDEAFANTGLTTITIPESVEVIRGNAFRGTKFPLPIQAELRRRGYTGSF